ncbi:MAG: hypothetical protein ACD_79C00193G0002 [uncultured bacterium]|nr:MAG: hypothetical protein ACD_79C00193G0002 [uncultured bacterium]
MREKTNFSKTIIYTFLIAICYSFLTLLNAEHACIAPLSEFNSDYFKDAFEVMRQVEEQTGGSFERFAPLLRKYLYEIPEDYWKTMLYIGVDHGGQEGDDTNDMANIHANIIIKQLHKNGIRSGKIALEGSEDALYFPALKLKLEEAGFEPYLLESESNQSVWVVLLIGINSLMDDYFKEKIDNLSFAKEDELKEFKTDFNKDLDYYAEWYFNWTKEINFEIKKEEIETIFNLFRVEIAPLNEFKEQYLKALKKLKNYSSLLTVLRTVSLAVLTYELKSIKAILGGAHVFDLAAFNPCGSYLSLYHPIDTLTPNTKRGDFWLKIFTDRFKDFPENPDILLQSDFPPIKHFIQFMESRKSILKAS